MQDPTRAQKKAEPIIESFSNLPSKEALYFKIMELGKSLSSKDDTSFDESDLVQGCQSKMYLKCTCVNGRMHFSAKSDALISSGLAAMMIQFYQDESPEFVLRQEPTFIEMLGIPEALSMGRANGLSSLIKKMKQEALNKLLLADRVDRG